AEVGDEVDFVAEDEHGGALGDAFLSGPRDVGFGDVALRAIGADGVEDRDIEPGTHEDEPVREDGTGNDGVAVAVADAPEFAAIARVEAADHPAARADDLCAAADRDRQRGGK